MMTETEKKAEINIGDKVYKLKVTLGFYKRLSFDRQEIAHAYNDAKKLFECIKLAIYFGNKAQYNWHSISDMESTISDEVLEDVEDPDLFEKLSIAIYNNLPESLKKAVDEQEDNSKKK